MPKLIWGFSTEQTPGKRSVEENPCHDISRLPTGELVAYQPMFIVREATYEEWAEGVIKEEGRLDGLTPNFFYEVLTD